MSHSCSLRINLISIRASDAQTRFLIFLPFLTANRLQSNQIGSGLLESCQISSNIGLILVQIYLFCAEIFEPKSFFIAIFYVCENIFTIFLSASLLVQLAQLLRGSLEKPFHDPYNNEAFIVDVSRTYTKLCNQVLSQSLFRWRTLTLLKIQIGWVF